MKKINKNGFTIIELMIASTIFAVVLLILTTGLLYMGKVYYRGVVASKTQEAARNLIDGISKDIQFSGGTIIDNPSLSQGYFCIGDKKYSYNVDKIQDKDPQHAVFVIKKACDGAQTSPAAGEDYQLLLPPNMRVTNLRINETSPNLYSVDVEVVYGPLDLYSSGFCSKSISAGGQFCAASKLSTVVEKRIE